MIVELTFSRDQVMLNVISLSHCFYGCGRGASSKGSVAVSEMCSPACNNRSCIEDEPLRSERSEIPCTHDLGIDLSNWPLSSKNKVFSCSLTGCSPKCDLSAWVTALYTEATLLTSISNSSIF